MKLVSSFLSSHMMFRVNTHLSFSNPPVATIPIVPMSLVSQVFWNPKHRLNKLPGVQTPLKQGIWRIVSRITPPKTNMEPEKEPLEEEIPMKNHHF